MKHIKLDKEEQYIESNLEKTSNFTKSRIRKIQSVLKSATKNTPAKNKTVNSRLPEKDIIDIKARAQKLGIPYQTLITSVLHQYN